MFSDKMKLFFGGLLVIAGIIVAIRGLFYMKGIRDSINYSVVLEEDDVMGYNSSS